MPDEMDAKQLRQLLPKNAQDADAARRLVALGPDVLGPVVPDMLRRLKDHQSPVADIYSEFFAANGERFVAVVGGFLARSSMPDLKNVIVTRILVHWSRDALAELSPTLQMLVTRSDFFNTDLVLIRLLHTHRLVDASWLEQWLTFKRDRLAQLSNEADEVHAYLTQP